MKHCGDPEPPSRNESDRLAGKLNKKVGAKRVNGCFHRDLKVSYTLIEIIENEVYLTYSQM